MTRSWLWVVTMVFLSAGGVFADQAVSSQITGVTVFFSQARVCRQADFGKIERDAIIREVAYRITAENRKDRPVTLHILDHVPVAATDRITVEDRAFEPEPAQRGVNGKPGVMRWELSLDPEETSQATISFAVAYPRDMPPAVF